MAKKPVIERLTKSSSAEQIEEYHRFVNNSPQGILYCKTWWLEATAPGRWEVLLARGGGGIRAAWPLVHRRDGRGVGMPELTQKLGVLFAPSNAKYARQLADEISLCSQFLEELPDNCGVQQNFHEAFTNWLPFHWAGFEQRTRYTYVIPELNDLKAVRAGMTERCKRTLKAACAAQLTASESDDLEQMRSIASLTFQRQGHADYPYSLELIERIDQACRDHAGRRLLLAHDPSGRVHSCDYMVYDERCAVSLIQGADPDLRKSGAQRFLDWESIQFAATTSQIFDFEGSMIQPIEVYNREFGARQMPYSNIWGTKRASNGKSAPVRRLVAKALRRLANTIDS